jgi:hypothetical protein
MGAIYELTVKLTQIPDVNSVRSLAEPLGDPPEPISARKIRKVFSPATRADPSRLWWPNRLPIRGDITRFEVVLDEKPFFAGSDSGIGSH